MYFLVVLIILFIIFFFIEKGWHLEDGWEMRATIITIGICIGGLILIFLYYSTGHH